MKSVTLSTFEVKYTKVTRQPQTSVFQEFTDEIDDIKIPTLTIHSFKIQKKL